MLNIVNRDFSADQPLDNGLRLDVSCLRSGNIPGIDGLRAISVLLVMAAHYGFGDRIPGGAGVTIFFFISGFLITTLMLRETGETGTVSICHFYVRRFLRLQPELLTYVAVSALAGVFYLNFPRLPDFASALLYVTNYWYIASTLGLVSDSLRWPQLWSLAVEEHYYLTYPLLFATCHRKTGRLLNVLIAICLAAFVWRCILVEFGAPQRYTYAATDARLDSIAYGCITSLILWRHSDILARFPRFLRLTLPLGLLVLLATLILRSPLFRETLRYSLQGLALSLIFLGMFTPAGRKKAAFLNARPMRWMGRMSYAAYLWHLEPLLVFKPFFGEGIATSNLRAALISVIGCGVTFVVAALSHHYVYRPVLALRRRFGSHAAE